MTARVDCLRRLVAALEAGEKPATADVVWFAAGAREYLRDAPAVRLDAALGLHPGWGEAGWWTTGPRAARDAVLGEIDRQLFGHLDIPTSAKSIVALARRRQERADLPEQQARLLDRLISAGKGVPGPKQIANILRNSRDPAAEGMGA